MIVVDTSVLVSLLRGTETKGSQALESIIKAEIDFGIPAPCLQEILQGARDAKEFNVIDSFLSKQKLLIPNDINSYREAAKIAFDCRRIGKTVRSAIDCLIAQLTLEADGVLLHEDKDFLAVQKVLPLKFLL
jgi:predicted nucleic acid-binding protein